MLVVPAGMPLTTRDTRQDLRDGWRSLGHTPGFTALVILTLALGIGATTTVFSVLNAIVVRPLPYQDPDRLAMLWIADARRGIREEGTSYPTFLDWKNQSRTFAAMAICGRGNQVTLSEGADPERVMADTVSANLFDVLGVTPALGRTFSADEEQRREPVVVLSHGLWQRRFGASPDAIGAMLEIDGRRFHVIGVMPAGFYFPAKDVQLWQPATFVGQGLNPGVVERVWRERFTDWWAVVGRLAPGATMPAAQAEMDAIGRRLTAAYPATDPGFAGFAVNVVPLLVQTTGSNLQLALWVLLGAVGFVLLIACANVANLLLARGAARQREFALRAALGATQFRLARQLAVETLMLGAGGGVVGVALALLGVRVLQAAAPPGIPRLDELDVDAAVLTFAAAITLSAALVFGMVPAWKMSRSDPGDALKDSGRGASAGLRLSRARRAFVIVECALAVALLAGAGLFLKSFVRLQAVEPGFAPERVLLVRVTTPTFSRELVERIAGLPGVVSAGAIQSFDPRNPDQPITVEHRAPLNAPLSYERVTGDFFQAMGVPLERGRLFTARDGGGDLAVINETMAKTFWGGENPLGRRFKRGGIDSTTRWITVVGIVGDMRRRGLEREVVSEFYLQEIAPSMDIVIRATADPLPLVPSVRQALRSFDRHAAVGRVTTVAGWMSELGAARRFQTGLITIFAALALALSAIGIYGVMHFAVAQRTQEMGIRIALGARVSNVLWLVIGEGLRLAAIGVVAGIGAALGLTEVVAHLLFEVSATDPATFAIVAVVLTGAAALACYLPARRASRVDPAVALRDGGVRA